MLDISAKAESGKLQTVSLSGEFDLYETEKVDNTLIYIYSQNPLTIIIDLSSISFMDSTGVGLLISWFAKFKESGIRMMLVLNTNAHVMRRLGRLLLLTEPNLKFYETIEEAKADIQ